VDPDFETVVQAMRCNEEPSSMLLSLYCGPGGLDLGFERAGFRIALAADKNPESINTYNFNRRQAPIGHVADLSIATLEQLDAFAGAKLAPVGVVGGPPCQSFSQANRSQKENDPRHTLPLKYAALLGELNSRHNVDFFAFENVPGLLSPPHEEHYQKLLRAFSDAGFAVAATVLNAAHFGVPQLRRRLIVVGYNQKLYPNRTWVPPEGSWKSAKPLTVRQAIGKLPEPTYFNKELTADFIPHHPNHWCMVPRSKKFTNGTLTPGNTRARCFKTLSWNAPSITVAYGNREVHVHPNCNRRLSVYEAMLLQGFPVRYQLLGTLSSQISQVSEAVPPPMAEAVAWSIRQQLGLLETPDQSTNDIIPTDCQ
jgi:DNA (cytosine-5)-methyltransferase 1